MKQRKYLGKLIGFVCHQAGSIMLEEHSLEEASHRFDHFKPIFLGGADKQLKRELDIWLKDYGWRDDIGVDA